MSGTVRRFRAGALALILLALSATMIARSPRAAAATLPAGFTESTIAQVLAPTAMAFAPDGRLFVASQGGPVRVIKDGRLLPTPFVTLNADNQGERGVVGLAFDPQFAQNRWVYITYTAKTPTIHQRVSRFTANGDVAVPGSEQVIFDFDPLRFLNHVAGATHFGPDGKLYVAQGENGIPRFAQQLDNLFGKIIRINKDGSIPTDNPFYNRTTGKNRAIWAYGLRNPFTFAFQPGTGRMFINDVGQDTWEEINEGAPGANYGWPTTEGPTTDARFRAPIFAYRHGTTADTGCSISGGAFYNPASATFPAAYHGAYFFPDFCQGWIKRINPATRQVTHFGGGFGRIVDLKVSADGALWVLGRNGSNRLAPVRRISFAGGSAAPAVTAHPADQTVAVGQEAVFSVSASGSAPLAYQWQRNGANIAGATAPTFRIASATMADHGDRFRVRVSNRAGAVFSNAATLTVLDNAPPVAAITQPTATRYRAGQTFTYAGTGTDPEDGALPASAFTWEVAFHHDDHTHPFVPPTSGSRTGSFTIPTVGETSANVWYRIHLTVRDSAGLTHHVTHDLRPETTTVELRTVPAGLTLTLDGAVATTPFTFTGVEGVVREIGAPSPQAAQGGSWRFASWSDGGPAVRHLDRHLRRGPRRRHQLRRVRGRRFERRAQGDHDRPAGRHRRRRRDAGLGRRQRRQAAAVRSRRVEAAPGGRHRRLAAAGHLREDGRPVRAGRLHLDPSRLAPPRRRHLDLPGCRPRPPDRRPRRRRRHHRRHEGGRPFGRPGGAGHGGGALRRGPERRDAGASGVDGRTLGTDGGRRQLGPGRPGLVVRRPPSRHRAHRHPLGRDQPAVDPHRRRRRPPSRPLSAQAVTSRAGRTVDSRRLSVAPPVSSRCRRAG
jgi:glucose/arabinose dehydrogenase